MNPSRPSTRARRTCIHSERGSHPFRGIEWSLSRVEDYPLVLFGRNRLQGDLGITAVLHTWGQKLDLHPHLHCIVTGGALSPDGKEWRSPKQRKFLFPVRALAALFRGKFLPKASKYVIRQNAQQSN